MGEGRYGGGRGLCEDRIHLANDNIMPDGVELSFRD